MSFNLSRIMAGIGPPGGMRVTPSMISFCENLIEKIHTIFIKLQEFAGQSGQLDRFGDILWEIDGKFELFFESEVEYEIKGRKYKKSIPVYFGQAPDDQTLAFVHKNQNGILFSFYSFATLISKISKSIEERMIDSYINILVKEVLLHELTHMIDPKVSLDIYKNDYEVSSENFESYFLDPVEAEAFFTSSYQKIRDAVNSGSSREFLLNRLRNIKPSDKKEQIWFDKKPEFWRKYVTFLYDAIDELVPIQGQQQKASSRWIIKNIKIGKKNSNLKHAQIKKGTIKSGIKGDIK